MEEEWRRQKVPLHGHLDLAGKAARLAGLVGRLFTKSMKLSQKVIVKTVK